MTCFHVMRIPKKYGESRVETCFFCQKTATEKNSQGISVCSTHRNNISDNLTCACGRTLELRHGKFGEYYNCIFCGSISKRKALEINDNNMKKNETTKREKMENQRQYSLMIPGTLANLTKIVLSFFITFFYGFFALVKYPL